MNDEELKQFSGGPDSTAVRTALWRAMHVLDDPPPHVIEDELGLRLAAPDDGWRARPDMDPDGTSGFRAAIVARARFIEDLVAEQDSRPPGTARAPPERRSSASTPRRKCWPGPAQPASVTSGTCQDHRSPNATSPAVPTACARRAARTCS